MTNLARFTGPLSDLDTPVFYRELENLATGADGLTTLVVDVGSSVTVGDARGGRAVILSGDTDNDEAALRSTNELWLPLSGKPILGQALVQYAEAATNAANVFFGFASAAGADLLVDNGGGVRTSGSIFGIYKVDGGTVWRAHSRNGATSTDSVSTTTAGGSAAQKLQVVVGDFDGVNCQAVFKVDDVYLKDANGQVIRHFSPLASATEMNLVAYVKQGTAAGETLNVEYLYAHQLR